LAFALGQGLASGVPDEILGPLPTAWEGTSLSITDAKGNTAAAPLVFTSQDQVTFQVPTTAAPGIASITINNATGASQKVGNVTIAAVAPALFTVNGSGLAAAYAVRVSGSNQLVEPAEAIDNTGGFIAAPIGMGSGSDQVYLSLFGTGLAGATLANTTVTVNGQNATVVYLGPQGSVPGLDQVNVLLPASLAGAGNVNVALTAAGIAANRVGITIE
jgi:uncharacterized protein (TIGR03437 family)